MQDTLQQLRWTPSKLDQQLQFRIDDPATVYPPAGQGDNFQGTVRQVEYCQRTGTMSVKLTNELTERVVTFDASRVKIGRYRDTTDRLVIAGNAHGILAIEAAKRR